jgi:hypothetical protein
MEDKGINELLRMANRRTGIGFSEKYLNLFLSII